LIEDRRIGKTHGDGRSRREAESPEQLGALVRAAVEVGIAQRFTALRHDDGRLVGSRAGMDRGMHSVRPVQGIITAFTHCPACWSAIASLICASGYWRMRRSKGSFPAL